MEPKELWVSKEVVECLKEQMLLRWESEEDPDEECLIVEGISWEDHWWGSKDRDRWEVNLSSTQSKYFWEWLQEEICDLRQEIREDEKDLKEDPVKYGYRERGIARDKGRLAMLEELMLQLIKQHSPFFVAKGLHSEWATFRDFDRKTGEQAMHSVLYALHYEKDPKQQWVVVYNAEREELLRIGPVPEKLKEFMEANTKYWETEDREKMERPKL